jgi:K+-transporting ATPase A subunit
MSQMAGTIAQSFLSAAAGIAVTFASGRGACEPLGASHRQFLD